MRTRFAVTTAFILTLSFLSYPGDARAAWFCDKPVVDGSGQTNRILVGEDSEWTWQWKENGKSLSVTIRGKVSFNDDYTEITGISKDGSIRIKDERDRVAKRFEAVANLDGTMRLSYSVDGQMRPINDEAKAWLAMILTEAVRQGGFDAPERVARIYKKRGANGVLEEISQLRSDYVKRIYFEELLKIDMLDPETARRVLRQAGREISSDYEKAQILIKVSENYVTDDATRTAYLDTVTTISSDYEKGRVLSALLKKENLSRNALAQTLRVCSSISSAYEKAKILKQVAAEYPTDGTVLTSFFEAVGTINSDYEKRRVLSTLLKQDNLSKENLIMVLRCALTISSDYDKSTILISMAATHLGNKNVIPAFLETVRTISSDYEQKRVFTALLKRNDLSKETLLLLIKSVARISSDYEKATVLMQVAAVGSGDEAIRTALIDVSKTLSSDYERGRVLSAVFK